MPEAPDINLIDDDAQETAGVPWQVRFEFSADATYFPTLRGESPPQVLVFPAANTATSIESSAFAACAEPDPNEVRRFGCVMADAHVKFVERIARHLDEDRQEAALCGEICPSQMAIDACRHVARSIADNVALAVKLKRAASANDDGSVSLVLQSVATSRRVNYRIPLDGATVSVLRVDEHLQTSVIDMTPSDAEALQEMAEWVGTPTVVG